MATRDLSLARAAFASGDPRLSRAAHGHPKAKLGSASPGAAVAGCEPGHDSTESCARNCAVYGAFEGAAVASTVIAAARALGLPPPTAITLALACVVGLAAALFVRDYVRFRSYDEHYHHERRREKWELDSYPEGEIKEMVELYEQRGVSKEDAKTIMKTLAKYDQVFVDLMMDQELVLRRPDGSPLGNAWETFKWFLVFGIVTLTVYAACSIGVSCVELAHAALPWLHTKTPTFVPVTATMAAAWLTALWVTFGFAAIKLRVLRHRPSGLWAQALVFITCCSVALIVDVTADGVHNRVTAMYETWTPWLLGVFAQWTGLELPTEGTAGV